MTECIVFIRQHRHTDTNLDVLSHCITPMIKRERVGIKKNDLTPTHFCVCPRIGPGFLTPYAMVFFLLNDME